MTEVFKRIGNQSFRCLQMRPSTVYNFFIFTICLDIVLVTFNFFSVVFTSDKAAQRFSGIFFVLFLNFIYGVIYVANCIKLEQYLRPKKPLKKQTSQTKEVTSTGQVSEADGKTDLKEMFSFQIHFTSVIGLISVFFILSRLGELKDALDSSSFFPQLPPTRGSGFISAFFPEPSTGGYGFMYYHCVFLPILAIWKLLTGVLMYRYMQKRCSTIS